MLPKCSKCNEEVQPWDDASIIEDYVKSNSIVNTLVHAFMFETHHFFPSESCEGSSLSGKTEYREAQEKIRDFYLRATARYERFGK